MAQRFQGTNVVRLVTPTRQIDFKQFSKAPANSEQDARERRIAESALQTISGAELSLLKFIYLRLSLPQLQSWLKFGLRLLQSGSGDDA